MRPVVLFSTIAFAVLFGATGYATSETTLAVTGAGGQIGYALIFRLASGAVFGPD